MFVFVYCSVNPEVLFTRRRCSHVCVLFICSVNLEVLFMRRRCSANLKLSNYYSDMVTVNSFFLVGFWT